MEGLTITALTVAKDAARNILTTAVEAGHTHGFGYWGNLVDFVQEADGTYSSLTITEHDAYGDSQPGGDKPRTKVITDDEVAAAVLKMVADGGVACDYPGFAKQLLSDDVDGPLAEAVVQVMCFGKVIYG